MKFSAIIAIAVAVVALTSMVAVEARPVLDRRAPQFQHNHNAVASGTQGLLNKIAFGIQVKNGLVQDPLVSMPFKSLFLGPRNISSKSFNIY
ncbi:hypothetical protein BDF22DRAFT_742185 [Syncephalis plumigaleata]|nr:hypothetical protein BDF22DRAFT_742185 [Syncephalis plumigaleata]